MTDEIKTTVLKINHHNAAHVAARWPYAAYGSNLSFEQMSERCPKAEVMVAGRILDHRLDFARFATITHDLSSTVPVGIYTMTQSDVETMDRREGLGRSYDRYLITPITDDGRAMRCFTYIKRDTVLQPPSDEYFHRLVRGYADWHFEDRRLRHARARSVKSWQDDAPRREADAKRREQQRQWVPENPWRAPRRREPMPDVQDYATVQSLVTGRELKVPRFSTAAHLSVEWGARGDVMFWRVKGSRTWYRDITKPVDLQCGLVRGEFEDTLPGAQAFKVVEGKDARR